MSGSCHMMFFGPQPAFLEPPLAHGMCIMHENINTPPLGSVHSLFPVLQSNLKFHFLQQSRNRLREQDDSFIDHIQGSREIATKLQILGFSKQGVETFCSTNTRKLS